MSKILHYLSNIWNSKSLRNKVLFTILLLALYRLLVFIPVPFANVDVIMSNTLGNGWWLEYFAMLLWGTLEQFSIIAVWLVPYINASIIMQLLTAVIPHLEELQEQWEVGTQKIQQYTRWLTFPLWFLQSLWMIYFINYLLGWGVIDTWNKLILVWTAFALTVGTVMLMWLWELITEKWITNGVSLIIFSSIVAWMTSKIYTFIASAGTDILSILIFMFLIVFVLVVLSVLLIRTRKEIPIVYARQWKVEETATLPIPLNPVGMIPIIFAIAFTTFPYLMAQIIVKFGTQNQAVMNISKWVENNFNIYTQNPTLIVIAVYFLLIVMFTFFYTLIVFNPEKISDNIQKRWWFIPGIRPGEETGKYINWLLMHLCFWWGIGLGVVWIYSYILNYIPFIQQATQSLGSIPIIVSWSWVIIIVWVVQDLLNKIDAELLMERYDRI